MTVIAIVCKCMKCDYEWVARVEKPKRCPNCQTKNWNTVDPQALRDKKYVAPFTKERQLHSTA